MFHEWIQLLENYSQSFLLQIETYDLTFFGFIERKKFAPHKENIRKLEGKLK